MDVLFRIGIWAIPVLFSIVIHEVAHGWMAYRLGDPTAKQMGRLTLNPVSHIDLFGTLVLPGVMILLGGPVFGWAKPVPYNPLNFRRHIPIKQGAMWVAVAGPGSNLILAFIASFVLVAAHKFFSPTQSLLYLVLSQFSQALLVINLWLACLNLVPIPPLDGSKILMRFLPQRFEYHFALLERYGFLILVVFLASGAFSRVIIGPFDLLLKLFLVIPKALLY